MYLSISAPRPTSPPAPTRDAHAALLAVPAEAAQVCRARHFATAVLRTWGLEQEACETAELVVAELAANAVQYGGGELTLRLSLAQEAGNLYVAVRDSGHIPQPRPGRDCDPCERGRGMEIVKYVTQWVHVEEHSGGRCVKACIRVPRTQPRTLPDRAAVTVAEPERIVAA
ncbi:ATP-binding protein [Streptomyces sp. SYSU K21746]